MDPWGGANHIKRSRLRFAAEPLQKHYLKNVTRLDMFFGGPNHPMKHLWREIGMGAGSSNAARSRGRKRPVDQRGNFIEPAVRGIDLTFLDIRDQEQAAAPAVKGNYRIAQQIEAVRQR